jgi:hypothetical protein
MENTPCCCGGAYHTLSLSNVGHSASHAYEFGTCTSTAMLSAVVRETASVGDGVMCDCLSWKANSLFLSHFICYTEKISLTYL